MISSAERTRVAKALEREVQEWVLRGFKPAYGKLTERFESHPRWRALQRAGTEPKKLIGELAKYDEAVASQAASLCEAAGWPVRSLEFQRAIDGALQHVQRGWRAYLQSQPPTSGTTDRAK